MMFFVIYDFFSKSVFFRNTNRVSNSLDPDHARQFIGPGLGPNYLQRFSTDVKKRLLADKRLMFKGKTKIFKILCLHYIYCCNDMQADQGSHIQPGIEVIKLFSYSTQLSTKFILLINVKMPTIVGILTFISKINTTP